MEDLKTVDWNKAPEGATHYNEDCACPWLKETPPSYFVENKGVWFEYSSAHPRTIKDHFNNAVKRPQEWDGIGIPPVGTVCEYSLNGCDVWFTCKIVYVLAEPDHSFVAWCDQLDMDQFFSFNTDDYTLQLRKIETPEQIAEEERQHAIDEMVNLSQRVGSTYKDGMSALYDAGYRKTDVK